MKFQCVVLLPKRLPHLCLVVCSLVLTCQANGMRVELNDFSSLSGWQSWTQREEVLPRCYVDQTQFRSAPNALAISGNSNAAEYGGWSYRLNNIQAGKFYRLIAYYRTQWVQHEQ